MLNRRNLLKAALSLPFLPAVASELPVWSLPAESMQLVKIAARPRSRRKWLMVHHRDGGCHMVRVG